MKWRLLDWSMSPLGQCSLLNSSQRRWGPKTHHGKTINHNTMGGRANHHHQQQSIGPKTIKNDWLEGPRLDPMGTITKNNRNNRNNNNNDVMTTLSSQWSSESFNAIVFRIFTKENQDNLRLPRTNLKMLNHGEINMNHVDHGENHIT